MGLVDGFGEFERGDDSLESQAIGVERARILEALCCAYQLVTLRHTPVSTRVWAHLVHAYCGLLVRGGQVDAGNDGPGLLARLGAVVDDARGEKVSGCCDAVAAAAIASAAAIAVAQLRLRGHAGRWCHAVVWRVRGQ